MIRTFQSRSFLSSTRTAARRIASVPSPISISRPVFVGRSGAVLRLKRCFAASADSEPVKEEKRRRRVSVQERREIVKAFVERYRFSSGGTFPTTTHVKKQTGGSYYVLRQIIQELQYNHKMSPKPEKHAKISASTDAVVSTTESPALKDVAATSDIEVPFLSAGSDKASIDESAIHLTVDTNTQIVEDIEESGMCNQISSDDRIEIDLEKDSPLRFSRDMQADASVQLKRKPEVDLIHPPVHDIRGAIKDDTSMRHSNGVDQRRNEKVSEPDKDVEKDSSLKFVSDIQANASVQLNQEPKVDLTDPPVHDIRGSNESSTRHGEEVDQRTDDEVSECDKLTSDSSRTIEKDLSSPKSSTFWGNLRSLADGILNLWRKK